VRYAEMLVDWLNAHMDDADAQEVAHLVSWYNVDRLEEDFPHLPHDVSEDELLRRVPRRLRHGLHGIRVDMHIHPSWDEGQKLHRNPIPDVAWTRSTLAWPPMSGGSKLTTLKLSSGRYILGIKSKRDTWDGLSVMLLTAPNGSRPEITHSNRVRGNVGRRSTRRAKKEREVTSSDRDAISVKFTAAASRFKFPLISPALTFRRV